MDLSMAIVPAAGALWSGAHQQLELLGRELKCPICLSLFEQAASLTCNHCFCMTCIITSMKAASCCPICKVPAIRREVRAAPHMDNLVSIYRTMETAAGVTLFATQKTEESNKAEGRNRRPGSQSASIRKRRRKPKKKNPFDPQERLIPAKKRIHVPQTMKGVFALDDTDYPNYPSDNLITKNCKGKRKSRSVELGMEDAPSLDDLEGFSVGHTSTTFKNVRQRRSCVEEEMHPGTELAPFFWVRDLPAEEYDTQQQGKLNEEDDDHYVPAFSDLKDSKDVSDSEALNGDKPAVESNEASSEQELENLIVQDTMEAEDAFDPEIRDVVVKNNAEPAVNRTKRQSISVPVVGHQAASGFTRKRRHTIAFPGDKEKVTESDNPEMKEPVCAFCQLSGQSMVVGKLMTYKDGFLVEVECDTSSQQSLTVHQVCAEWAPEVYFADSGVQNLEAAVTRGQKMKCSDCGQKGAALGCFVKRCRKSFHYPCAIAASKCKWDLVNFIMLCPDHAHCDFSGKSKDVKKKPKKCSPKQIFKSKPDLKNISIPCSLEEGKSCDVVNTSKTVSRQKSGAFGQCHKWVICGSAVNFSDKSKLQAQLAEFARVTGAKVVRSWSEKVTHVVTATDERGVARRTMKFLMGILEGKWVVKLEWIGACLAAGRCVEEEAFEVCVDIYGVTGGPKLGRIIAQTQAPRLFNGLCFYMSGQFQGNIKSDLQAIVHSGNGTVLQRKPISSSDDNVIIVYDATHGDGHHEAHTIASATHAAAVVEHTWILHSAAACRLQPPLSCRFSPPS